LDCILKDKSNPKTGLILSGGGARAAYQVGVLKAISRILPKDIDNPFDVICGTSAGAINAVAMASYANQYRIGIRHLERIWKGFSSNQVYRSDFFGLSHWALKWLKTLFFGNKKNESVSLLNNAPLGKLLSQVIKFDGIQQAIDAGNLHAVSVTASGYSSGESVSFFQGHYSIKNWQRHRRIGARGRLNIDHLMASSAIPTIFPAVKINREYFGDGAVRQLAPISPALHLGAERVLVIGVSGTAHKRKEREKVIKYPSIANVVGHMLNAAFLDSMEGDVERFERINRTVSIIPEETKAEHNLPLKSVDLLEISPSESLDSIADRHHNSLPKTLRMFLSGAGTTSSDGAGLLSYLLFERDFCQDLIQHGFDDAMARKDEIEAFFGVQKKDTENKAAS
jgi:NTE family protein